MSYRLLADAVLLLHFGFVLFASVGALLLLRWPRLAWVHLPAVLWAGVIELTGGICPLTPLESWLRVRGGEAGYAGSFVEHWLGGLLYPGPARLTAGVQLALGIGVLLLNAGLYAFVIQRRRAARRKRRRV